MRTCGMCVYGVCVVCVGCGCVCVGCVWHVCRVRELYMRCVCAHTYAHASRMGRSSSLLAGECKFTESSTDSRSWKKSYVGEAKGKTIRDETGRSGRGQIIQSLQKNLIFFLKLFFGNSIEKHWCILDRGISILFLFSVHFVDNKMKIGMKFEPRWLGRRLL